MGLLVYLCGSMFGCAALYDVQLGDINASQGTLTPFVIKVSETGVSIHEAAKIGETFARMSNDRELARTIRGLDTIIALFQYGPRTGNLVYSDIYADRIFADLRKQCPSGRITGLVSIRESMKYPVISGEIVKIMGYCVSNRKANHG